MATGGTAFHPFQGVDTYDPARPQPIAAVPDGKAAICGEGERSPGHGWKRFRIRGESPGMSPLPVRYVIARSQADAEACYTEAEGAAAKLVVAAMPD